MNTTQRLLLSLLLCAAVTQWASTVASAESPGGAGGETALVNGLLAQTSASKKTPGEASDGSVLLQELADEVRSGLSTRFSILGFAVALQPVNSSSNPNNDRQIPRYVTELDLRPNFNLNFRQLDLSVDPRLQLRWQWWEDGGRQGDNSGDSEGFVQYWLARYRLTNQHFVSYGRENLQWGPSYLLSPSNPFNQDNGQNNPMLEVPGMEYGRAVWIPSQDWTVSFIANVDNGRLNVIRNFKKTYAMKLDYTIEKKYFSLIPSYREDGTQSVGFLSNWTVSDALLLHIEGSVPNQMDDTEILVGGAYTLERGPTIVAEYFHNGSGCSQTNIAECYALGFARKQPVDSLLRQNYLFVQYGHTRISDTNLNITLRWIRDLDGDSNAVIGIFEYGLGDRTQLFLIGNANAGNKDAEFGSLLKYSIMTGVRFTL